MCKDDDGAARHARRVHNRRIAAEERRTGPPKGSLSCTVTIGSSSALRGFATRGTRLQACRIRRGPHQPYEGSQREYGLAYASGGGVLISPTRVRNIPG